MFSTSQTSTLPYFPETQEQGLLDIDVGRIVAQKQVTEFRAFVHYELFSIVFLGNAFLAQSCRLPSDPLDETIGETQAEQLAMEAHLC